MTDTTGTFASGSPLASCFPVRGKILCRLEEFALFSLNRLAFAAAAVIFLSPGASQAAPAVTTSQATFMGWITNPGIDTFDDLTPSMLLNSPLSRSVGGYSYDASASNGFYPQPGQGTDVWLSVNAAGDELLLNNFSASVKGVGGFFFATDYGGAPISANVVVTGSDGTTSTYTLTPGSPTTFLGFFSNSGIQSINIQAVQVNSVDAWSTANDLVLGTAPAVPEPASYALALLGLGVVVGAVRRRKA